MKRFIGRGLEQRDFIVLELGALVCWYLKVFRFLNLEAPQSKYLTTVMVWPNRLNCKSAIAARLSCRGVLLVTRWWGEAQGIWWKAKAVGSREVLLWWIPTVVIQQYLRVQQDCSDGMSLLWPLDYSALWFWFSLSQEPKPWLSQDVDL